VTPHSSPPRALASRSGVSPSWNSSSVSAPPSTSTRSGRLCCRDSASLLRAPLDELAGLPETFLIVDENDVLRAEGEAYARVSRPGAVAASILEAVSALST